MENQPVQASQPVRLPSAFELFKPSMHAIGVNLATFVSVILIGAVPIAVFYILLFIGIASASHTNAGLNATLLISGILLFLSFLFLIPFISAALTYTMVNSAREQKVSTGQALNAGKQFLFKFLLLNIILGVIYIISFILLIVPFFFMLKRYFLSQYYMMDQNLSALDAMKHSAEDSKQYSSELWGIIGVQFLIGALGIIPILGSIGSPIAAILYSCAPVVRYQQIRDKQQNYSGMQTGMHQNPPTNPMPPQQPNPVQ